MISTVGSGSGAGAADAVTAAGRETRTVRPTAVGFTGAPRRLAGRTPGVVGVHVAKGAIDRPRPDGVLVQFTGSSYPSGHAAYSATWVAAAYLVTRRQGVLSRATLLLVAVIVSAAIGIARIYLHVHFWSDVAGGWGLGYGIFGAAGTIALIVAYLRHNGDSETGG